MAPPSLTAGIILAGGRATRLGGVNKGQLRLDGVTLLQRSCEALRDAARVVVVGPPVPGLPAAVRLARETPRFAGPACAVAAGLRALADLPETAQTVVLPCDLADPGAVVTALRSAGPRVVLRAGGRMQWATVAAPLGELRRAFRLPAGPAPGAPLRGSLEALSLTPVDVPEAVSADLDTLDDVRRYGAELPKEEHMAQELHPDLEPWVAQVAPRLGLTPDEVPLQTVLDLAREVAHGAVRPGAPVTAYMLGLAVGSGRVSDVAAAAAELGELADGWQGAAEQRA